MIIKTQGIILHSKPIFEADKRVEILSNTLGKCGLLAKHACRSKKRFSGRIEPFNIVDFILKKGKSFYIIDHCEIIKSFSSIRLCWDKIQLSAFITNIIRKSTVAEQHHLSFYELLSFYLDKISISERSFLPTIKDRFYGDFLLREGLLERPQKITDQHFKSIFENYSGKPIFIPSFSSFTKFNKNLTKKKVPC